MNITFTLLLETKISGTQPSSLLEHTTYWVNLQQLILIEKQINIREKARQIKFVTDNSSVLLGNSKGHLIPKGWAANRGNMESRALQARATVSK